MGKPLATLVSAASLLLATGAAGNAVEYLTNGCFEPGLLRCRLHGLSPAQSG
jgi:hypothetical protein